MAGSWYNDRSNRLPDKIIRAETVRAASGVIRPVGIGLRQVRSIRRSVLCSCTWLMAPAAPASRNTPAADMNAPLSIYPDEIMYPAKEVRVTVRPSLNFIRLNQAEIMMFYFRVFTYSIISFTCSSDTVLVYDCIRPFA